MPKPALSVAREFASRARGLDMYLRRIEKLHSQGNLPRSDVERAYAGVFLEFHAFLERSLERLFLGLLRGRFVSSDSAVQPLIDVNSDAVALAVVRGSQRYANWLPYERFTLRRAKAFFSRGLPFSRLDKPEISAFTDASIIRNALAHQSGAALRSFRKTLVEGRNLPPSEHRPSPYLRGFHTIGQRRMNYNLAMVTTVIGTLCK